MDTIKKFAFNSSTTSMNERNELFEELFNLLEDPNKISELPEAFHKVLGKIIYYLFPLYTNKKSKVHLIKLIHLLVKLNNENAFKIIIQSLDAHSKVYISAYPNRPNSMSSIYGIDLVNELLIDLNQYNSNVLKSLNDEFKELVTVYANFFYSAYNLMNKQVNQEVLFKKIKHVCDKIPALSTEMISTLSKISETSPYSLVLSHFLIKYLDEKKSDVKPDLNEYKTLFIDAYLKHVLGTRFKPAKHYIQSSNLILRHVTRDHFKEKFLPAIQRSLLRNPELVIELISFLIEDLVIDLSEFSTDLIQVLSSQLLAKDETNRQESCYAIKSLSKQCSDVNSIQNILKRLFFILNGGEGKLATPANKCIVLTAIGNVSFNCSRHTEDVLGKLIQLSSDYLSTETHDATLQCALQQLNLWFSKTLVSNSLNAEFIKTLNSFFKKMLDIKTFSPIVRGFIIHSMTNLYSKNSIIHEATGFIPLFTQSIEKAVNQFTQIQIMYEAINSAILLVTLLTAEPSLEPKLLNVLNLIYDNKKQLFTNEKFYTNSSIDGLKDYCLLFNKLNLLIPSKETLDFSSYFNGYIYTLLHNDYELRKTSQTLLKQLWKWSGSKVAVQLLDTAQTILSNIQTVNNSSAAETTEWPSAKGLCDCALTLVSIPNLTRVDVETLAFKVLLLANHKLARSFDPMLYNKCLHRLLISNRSNLSIMPLELIQSKKQAFIELTLESGPVLNETQLNAIETLSNIDNKEYLKETVKYALNILSDPRLTNVTKEEFEIMKLKDGELFDKTLVEAAIKQQETSSQGANLKRESKAYSYKDQLAEIELKKELEKKKQKKESSSQAVAAASESNFNIDSIRSQLSKKQQELLDLQIEKESKIRKNTKNLHDLVNKATSIILKLIEGNEESIKDYLVNIVNSIIHLTKSPLCSTYMFRIYKELANRIFMSSNDSQSFGNSIVYCYARLSNSPFTIESNWLVEPIDKCLKRLLAVIKKEVTQESKHNLIDISKAAFFLPFLYYGAIKLQNSKKDEESIEHLVGIIQTFSLFRSKVQHDILERKNQHSLVEFNESFEEKCENDDAILTKLINNFPTSEYISLLLKIISSTDSIKIQNEVNDTLKTMFKFTSKLDEENINLTKQNLLLQFSEITRDLISQLSSVRETCLDCISILVYMIEYLEDSGYQNVMLRVWVSCYDANDNNRQKALNIWNDSGMETNEELCRLLVNDVFHSLEHVRLSAAEALAAALKNHENIIQEVLEILIRKYNEFNKLPEPEVDQFGRLISNEETIDNWESRNGIASALVFLAELVPNDFVVKLYSFFVNSGLNDRNDSVKVKMLEASIATLNKHGNSNKNELLSLFETFLETAPKSAQYDSVRQNVVLLMGTLAKHLDKEDPKIPPIIGKLVQALQTPSQQVQEAVANCLYPLMPSIKSQVPTYVSQMMNVLLTAQTYGERRGAAYGLAGMLKGIGMLSLKQLNILQNLNDAVNNKSNPKQRESALLAYEMLTIMFSKVFEPYSVEILPNLLLCFGDSDANVRAAADDCAKAIMANLTFTGVKMILPKLLEHLGEEESWRTKCGSVELLGAMAHCAPKQLGTCLPSIVPKLTEVLSDSHVKVQKSATQALKQIGSVIKNPEILAITDTLLEALQEPAQKTQHALHILLETKFVHFIDAASLALIMPVVHRAFQDRSTETRKMAAQIMGNMYALTDQKDLQPYLPSILPGLKLSLLDPVPEVRSVSAKAMGAMIRAIGENSLKDIIAWLMEKLVSENSSVDRSGAAQGLSEVFGALGVSQLEQAMPEIIDRAEQVNISPFVRDGYMMMFIYLPLTFTNDFVPYLGRIIPPILKALADENEFVRETALKAGQRMVNTYAETAISIFLPELEKGLFDSNWRIRYSSVQLLGDLLYKISGVVGKMTTESSHEDDNFGTETGQKSIINALGLERRNRVYAGLYMGRSDVSILVRQAALHVWKIIVSNTPKTLKEILPILFNLLLGCLASANPDKRQIAAATLVDIVRKLGERILPDIIPILEYGLNSERSEQRQGVCIGLTEIMASTSKDNIILFSDSLIPTVRKALMDPLPEVRNCAARTFDNLHNMIGVKALEDISVYLLDMMKTNEAKEDSESKKLAERALDGLKQIMAVKSRVLLPYLIANLTQPPVNIHALCKLCSCAAVDVLSKHLSKILNTLVQALSSWSGNEGGNSHWIKECESLLLSINDHDGVRTIVNELLNHIQSNTSENSYKLKLAALDMLTWFCSKTQTDFSNHFDDLTKGLLNLFAETDEQLVAKAWNCLNCIIEPLKGNVLLQRLPAIRQALRVLLQQAQKNIGGAKSLNKTNVLLHGFCLPKKGISCILPVFKEGLLTGTPEIKEQSSLTLTDCIKLADSDSLKSCVMAVTGPLIRVLGERYSWTVKSAVLDSIYYLLLKVDVTLRPFLPQLQPTFLKALNDPNRTVRLKSGYALAKLLLMNPRFDSVITEVHGYIKNADDLQMKETLVNALRLCLNSIGSKLSDENKKQLLETLRNESNLYSDEEQIRTVAAGALGSLAVSLNDRDFNELFDDLLDLKKYSSLNWKYLHANSMVTGVTLQYNATKLSKYDTKLFSFISNCVTSDRAFVCMSGMRCVVYLIEDQIKNSIKIETDLAVLLAKSINNNSSDVKQLSVHLVSYLATSSLKPLDSSLLKLFIPMLVNGTKERAPSVRNSSEIALVHLLFLNKSDTILNDSLILMEKMKETLSDCVKSLSKDSINQSNSKEIAIDETLLKIDS